MKKNTQHQRYKDYKQRKENAKHKKENSRITTFSMIKDVLIGENNKFARMSSTMKKHFVYEMFLEKLQELSIYILSFSMQALNYLVDLNLLLLSVIMLIVYISKGYLTGIIRSMINTNTNLWMQERMNESIIKAYELLMITRGKVWKNGKLMESSVILSNSAAYISNRWDFISKFLSIIFSVLMSLSMLIPMFFSLNGKSSLFFIIILIIIIISKFIIEKFNIKTDNKLAEEETNISNYEHIQDNDIKNLDIINMKHYEYMKNNSKKVKGEALEISSKRTKNRNKWLIVERFILVISVVALILHEVVVVGNNISSITIVLIISNMTIFDTIISRVFEIFSERESLFKYLKTTLEHKKYFNIICRVYEREMKIKENKLSNRDIDFFFIDKGDISYLHSIGRKYKLHVPRKIKLAKGDRVLIEGSSGSGKSTLLKMITGKDDFKGYIPFVKSEICQIGNSLGSNDVLSEVTLGDQNLDREKLMTILEGLHLYSEFKLESSDVFNFMKSTKSTDFSDGQRQRLVLARLLYNLEDDVLVIAFDEATNALNDEILELVMAFIIDYLKDDRILIFSSHQVKIVEKYVNKKIVISTGIDGFEAVEECCEEAEDLVA